MSDIQSIVVGAGVIGLAIGRALAQAGRTVIVLEAAGTIGSATSSRNSEVIHAGLYYPTGSLKARLCLEGRHRLYQYLTDRNLPHRRCGKLVVAANQDDLAALDTLARRGAANGVDDLQLIDAATARRLEPALACVGALNSPSTGIFDSAAYLLALRGDLEDAGGDIAFHAPFEAAERQADGFRVRIGGPDAMTLTCETLINCAGLQASRVAAAIDALPPDHVPQTRYAKGNYFSLTGRAPFSRLIYPAPHSHGLGVHLTFDLGGQCRFGPDVEWVEAIDYSVAPDRARGFAAAIRTYWPELGDDALVPAYSGIRPKIAGPDQAAPDFRIDGPETHGVPGLVNLFGIESPGLTSSLAIAGHTMSLLA